MSWRAVCAASKISWTSVSRGTRRSYQPQHIQQTPETLPNTTSDQSSRPSSLTGGPSVCCQHLTATLAFDRSAPLKRCVQSHLGESLQFRKACVWCLTSETVWHLLAASLYWFRSIRSTRISWRLNCTFFCFRAVASHQQRQHVWYYRTRAFTDEMNSNIWPTAAGPEAEFGLTEGQLWTKRSHTLRHGKPCRFSVKLSSFGCHDNASWGRSLYVLPAADIKYTYTRERVGSAFATISHVSEWRRSGQRAAVRSPVFVLRVTLCWNCRAGRGPSCTGQGALSEDEDDCDSE